MKKISIESGDEVIYVQIGDITYLIEEGTKLPTAVNDAMQKNTSDQLEFIRFEEKEVIEFFRGIDFIVDYNYYKNFSKKQMREEINRIKCEMDKLAEEWKNSAEDFIESMDILNRFSNLDYMVKCLEISSSVKF